MKNRVGIKRNIAALLMTAVLAFIVFVVVTALDKVPGAGSVYQLASEFFCLACTFVMYVWHLGNRSEEDETGRLFAILCVIMFSLLACDIIALAVEGRKEYWWLNYAVSFAVSLLLYIHSAVFIRYMFSLGSNIKRDTGGIEKPINFFLQFLLVFTIIMILLGGYFSISPDGFYQNGPYVGISALLLSILVFFCCGVVTGAGITWRQSLAVMSYPIAITGELLLQGFCPAYVNILVGITVSMIFIYCAMSLDAGESREKLDRGFRTYLSDDIVKEITASEEEVEPGGRLQYVTMLFCLLHGFGEKMELMDPETGVAILNHFYDVMMDVVARFGGTLLEFPGYGFFVVFGAFHDGSDHADRAVRTADAIQTKMEAVNAWNETNGYPALKAGVGINTGDAVLGNVGSKNHMRFTAISSSVNLASRIEGYAGDGEIIVTETTRKECTCIEESERLCTIFPKGISAPIDVYKVVKIRK